MKKEIVLWQNKTEQWVEYTSKGKTESFINSSDLVSFLQKISKNKQVCIKIEQV